MESGYHETIVRVKESAVPIDNVTKFAYDDDDYETVEVWHEYTEEELAAQAETEAKQVYNSQIEKAITILVNNSASTMSVEQMTEVDMLFNNWTIGTSYNTGDVVKYNGGLWQCLQPSVAQDIYPPDQFVAGWKRIGNPNPEGIFPWSQPLGATDAYPLGAKVTHNGKTWKNTIANNVWEPGVYGWKEVEDSGQTEPTDPDKPTEDEYPEWVQPTGAHDAYDQGAKVSHNGKKWTSDVSANVWEPGVYGWTEVK